MSEIVRSVNVKEYVEQRAVQVAQLLQMVDNTKLVNGEVTKGPRTAAQRLPRHMRRRAMAYEVRRFPKGLRTFAAVHVKLTKHRKKPPSRFYRRRPTNLLLNYIRRNKNKIWLETHIWNAKRFHMIDRWGYRVPDRSFQRNFRPCYRDSMRHCSIRDKSLLCCITISHSSQQQLINLLKPLFENRTSPTLAYKSALSGRLEISSMLYEPGKYPKGFIGPCRLQWSTTRSNGSKLILWVHPSCHDQLIQTLISILKLSKVDTNNENIDLDTAYSKEEWRLKAMKFNTTTYENKNEDIIVNDLKDQLVRLRLYGPYSLPIVSNVLKLAEMPYSTDFEKNHAEWISSISKHQSGEIMDGSVFSLLVEDFRIVRPSKRQLPTNDNPDNNAKFEHCIPQSHIWDLQNRIEVLEKRLSDSDLKLLNSKTVGAPSETPAKIPVLVIIRNSGTGRSDPLTGCEVILPSGFGLDFWISAQLFTAHASGERDDQAAHLEAKRLAFPFDSLDCKAGFEEEKRINSESEEKYRRRPHNRRVVYWNKLSIRYPFSFLFDELVKDWTKAKNLITPDDCYILRDRRILETLNQCLIGKGKASISAEILQQHSNALIPVQLECIARGKPKKFGLICLPTSDDLIKVKRRHTDGPVVLVQPSRHTREDDKVTEIEEAMEVDEENNRSKNSVGKKKWQDDMWKGVVNVDPSTREKPIPLKPLFPDTIVVDRKMKRKLLNRKKKINAKRRKVDRLLRLSKLEEEQISKTSVSYKDSANRLTIGRIVRGDFSFSSSQGCALGYIPLCVLEDVRKSGGTVLVRNSTSKYYHPTRLSILTAMCEL